jgi:hypothetical protein
MRPLENLPVSLWSSGTREAEPFPMLSAPGLVAATVPEILAIWEDCKEQLIDPNQKRCRHRAASNWCGSLSGSGDCPV